MMSNDDGFDPNFLAEREAWLAGDIMALFRVLSATGGGVDYLPDWVALALKRAADALVSEYEGLRPKGARFPDRLAAAFRYKRTQPRHSPDAVHQRHQRRALLRSWIERIEADYIKEHGTRRGAVKHIKEQLVYSGGIKPSGQPRNPLATEKEVHAILEQLRSERGRSRRSGAVNPRTRAE